MNASEQNSILDALLGEWHHWAQGEQHSRGFANTSAGMGQWRASRQYDSDNGALDTDIDKSTMKTIDFHVSQMDDPYRSAIYMEAKNLAAGRHVFHSPRVPTGLEGANVMKVARLILINRLANAGVL